MTRRITLLALSLLASTSLAMTQKGLVIHTLGDSTTARRKGIRQVWPDRLRNLCRGRPPVIGPIVHNRGVPSQTSAGAVGALGDSVTGADRLTIQFGINDASVDTWRGATEPRVSRQAYRANLRALVSSRGINTELSGVILMTPNPLRWTKALKERYGRAPYDIGDPRGLDLIVATYASEVRELAREVRVPLIDVHRIFTRRDRFPGHHTRDLLLDGMHPNDEGHRMIAHLVTAELYRGTNYERGQPDYDIPVLDLSRDRHRQVIVDREKGQYLGHPTTVLLEDDKTMLTVYPKGHGRGAIVMKRSTDAGLTWSDRLATPATWATSKEVPTIHRVVDAAGTKRLIMFSGLYPIRMARSEDDGDTWSELAPIGDFGGIVAMGCVIPLKKPGAYLAMFHDDGRFFRGAKKRAKPPVFRLFSTRSDDGGLTWAEPREILSDAMRHHCEPGYVRSPDGDTIAVFLRENSRTHNSHVIFSKDEGETWSRPRELPGALTGDRHIARYAPDGRLFITFRDRTLVSPTWGDWVAWVGTWDDVLKGEQGQYRVRLMDNTKGADCAYPGLEMLPDGTFITTTYGHWTKGEMPYVVSVRVHLDELDALAEDPRERR